MLHRSWLSLTLLVVCACAGSRAQGARDRYLITEAEIEASAQLNAYEVVQALRPEFLRTRGTTSFRATEPVEAVVYVDGLRTGDPSTLRGVPREVVREIRYIDAREATTRYGTGHGGGVIMVSTKR
ncbi:MAG: hypothetical protein ACREL7_08770 [Longimicrobiales bacterium]